MGILTDEFVNPGPDKRALPFWAWNGRLEENELKRQIDIMEQMGFGGFFMHSRTGLQTEYLGDEWFELTNACADYAATKKMGAWLYDEDRWPSGIAGGMVTKDPEYRMLCLKMEILPPETDPPTDALAFFYCKMDGDTMVDYRVVTASDANWNPDQLLVFRVVPSALAPAYNGYAYLDTMNRKATDRFIELTHEAYAKRCGNRLGGSIPGIFTDEPHRGTLMDTFGTVNEGDIYRVPWTSALPEEYAARFGGDLLAVLPEVFQRVPGGVSRVKWCFVELCQQLFLENFMQPIYEWCEAHGLAFTGHVLHEDSLTAQTVMNGSMLRNYEYMSWPGIDQLGGNNTCYWIAKQIQSAARQLGKTKLLSEMCGCSGWQMTLQEYKRLGDWQALFGITVRCPHLSWYTMEGEGKRDYPASIFYQSAWWPEYKKLEDYYARINVVMQQGRPECDLLVVSPLESVWSQVHVGWANNLTAVAPEIVELEENYTTLFGWLCEGHVDFDYGDEDFIARMGVVVTLDGKPVLKVGEAMYRTVLVRGLVTMRESTRNLLANFAQTGGEVIFAGTKPRFADARPAPAERFAFGVETGVGRDTLMDMLSHLAIPLEAEGVFAQIRSKENQRYIMLLNMSDTPTLAKLKVDGHVTNLCCRTGETEALPVADGLLTLMLAPRQEALLLVQADKPAVPAVPAYCAQAPAVSLGQPVSYRLDEPNVCVLDVAELEVDGGCQHAQGEVLKLDRVLRDYAGLPWRGGDMLQPWFREKQGIKGETKIIPFSLTFTFGVEVLPEASLWLAVEHPEQYTITVNDVPLPQRPDGWWVDPCYTKLPVDAVLLRKGKNTVCLTGDYTEDYGLEALYLLGQFGVHMRETEGAPVNTYTEYAEGVHKLYGGVTVTGPMAVLTVLPATLALGSLVEQGLPFYSGRVGYQFALPPGAGSGRFSIDGFAAACLKVTPQGSTSEGEVVYAEPYTCTLNTGQANEIIVEAVLGRRNTFGPLHLLPVVDWAYGPDAFISEGEKYTPGYALVQTGLYKSPNWIWMNDQNNT